MCPSKPHLGQCVSSSAQPRGRCSYFGVLFYLGLCALMALGWRIHGLEGPTDEIAGTQTKLDDWKL